MRHFALALSALCVGALRVTWPSLNALTNALSERECAYIVLFSRPAGPDDVFLARMLTYVPKSGKMPFWSFRKYATKEQYRAYHDAWVPHAAAWDKRCKRRQPKSDAGRPLGAHNCSLREALVPWTSLVDHAGHGARLAYLDKRFVFGPTEDGPLFGLVPIPVALGQCMQCQSWQQISEAIALNSAENELESDDFSVSFESHQMSNLQPHSMWGYITETHDSSSSHSGTHSTDLDESEVFSDLPSTLHSSRHSRTSSVQRNQNDLTRRDRLQFSQQLELPQYQETRHIRFEDMPLQREALSEEQWTEIHNGLARQQRRFVRRNALTPEEVDEIQRSNFFDIRNSPDINEADDNVQDSSSSSNASFLDSFLTGNASSSAELERTFQSDVSQTYIVHMLHCQQSAETSEALSNPNVCARNELSSESSEQAHSFLTPVGDFQADITPRAIEPSRRAIRTTNLEESLFEACEMLETAPFGINSIQPTGIHREVLFDRTISGIRLERDDDSQTDEEFGRNLFQAAADSSTIFSTESTGYVEDVPADHVLQRISADDGPEDDPLQRIHAEISERVCRNYNSESYSLHRDVSGAVHSAADSEIQSDHLRSTSVSADNEVYLRVYATDEVESNNQPGVYDRYANLYFSLDDPSGLEASLGSMESVLQNIPSYVHSQQEHLNNDDTQSNTSDWSDIVVAVHARGGSSTNQLHATLPLPGMEERNATLSPVQISRSNTEDYELNTVSRILNSPHFGRCSADNDQMTELRPFTRTTSFAELGRLAAAIGPRLHILSNMQPVSEGLDRVSKITIDEFSSRQFRPVDPQQMELLRRFLLRHSLLLQIDYMAWLPIITSSECIFNIETEAIKRFGDSIVEADRRQRSDAMPSCSVPFTHHQPTDRQSPMQPIDGAAADSKEEYTAPMGALYTTSLLYELHNNSEFVDFEHAYVSIDSELKELLHPLGSAVLCRWQTLLLIIVIEAMVQRLHRMRGRALWKAVVENGWSYRGLPISAVLRVHAGILRLLTECDYGCELPQIATCKIVMRLSSLNIHLSPSEVEYIGVPRLRAIDAKCPLGLGWWGGWEDHVWRWRQSIPSTTSGIASVNGVSQTWRNLLLSIGHSRGTLPETLHPRVLIALNRDQSTAEVGSMCWLAVWIGKRLNAATHFHWLAQRRQLAIAMRVSSLHAESVVWGAVARVAVSSLINCPRHLRNPFGLSETTFRQMYEMDITAEMQIAGFNYAPSPATLLRRNLAPYHIFDAMPLDILLQSVPLGNVHT